ncbi:MAG TPA: FAD-dependent monooxygenase, partial [Streptosporangiaceae bacterium]
PPNGGYGGNTGIQDAHNLAWKLAHVLARTADPSLLQTYDTERRAVGDLTVEQAYARYVTRVAQYLSAPDVKPLVDDFSMEIGYCYNSPAVIFGPDDSAPLHEHPAASLGRPGSRAPHVVLDRAGSQLSTLDLLGRNFVLLAGSAGAAWCTAALDAGRQAGVGLDAWQVGGDDLRDDGDRFPGAYGISPSGAAVVRPDGFVGWRAVDDADASPATVVHVLRTLLCRGDARTPSSPT